MFPLTAGVSVAFEVSNNTSCALAEWVLYGS